MLADLQALLAASFAGSDSSADSVRSKAQEHLQAVHQLSRFSTRENTSDDEN